MAAITMNTMGIKCFPSLFGEVDPHMQYLTISIHSRLLLLAAPHSVDGYDWLVLTETWAGPD